MTRNLKALGLALLAICALGAVAASGASAKEFTSTGSPTAITGEQVGEPSENVFGTKSSSLSVTCPKATFGGTVVGTSVESITVHPTYFECTAGALGNAPVDTAGCNYILHSTTVAYKNTSGTSEGEVGKADVECEAGKSIAITGAGGCTITIGAQTGLLGIKYTNEGAGATADVKATVKIDNIAYTTDGFFCGLVGLKSSGTDAFLTETVTAKGFEDKDASGPVANQDAFSEGLQRGISYK